MAGNFTGALGALATGLPALLAYGYGLELPLEDRSGFVLYAAIAVVTALVYLRLGPTVEARSTVPSRSLARSRRIVIHLSALFSLGVTTVPRSLAAALPPLFTGAMLTHSAVGWPLVCRGRI